MDAVLHILGLSILLAVCLLALMSLVLGLPGTFLIVGAAIAVVMFVVVAGAALGG